MQAVAVSLSMHKTITLCSVYIPPSYALDNRESDHLLEQSPFIVLGDMNARNTNWGNPDTKKKCNLSGTNKFRASFMQCILNWDSCLTNPRSVEETNSFFVASISEYTPDTPALTGWRSSTSLCLLSGTFVRGAHPD